VIDEKIILIYSCHFMLLGDESVELGDPENPGIAVGNAFLSVVEREIKLLPVWQPLFCTSGGGRYRGFIDYVAYIWASKICF
jgi:hypothetical protein